MEPNLDSGPDCKIIHKNAKVFIKDPFKDILRAQLNSISIFKGSLIECKSSLDYTNLWAHNLLVQWQSLWRRQERQPAAQQTKRRTFSCPCGNYLKQHHFCNFVKYGRLDDRTHFQACHPGPCEIAPCAPLFAHHLWFWCQACTIHCPHTILLEGLIYISLFFTVIWIVLEELEDSLDIHNATLTLKVSSLTPGTKASRKWITLHIT